MEVWELIYEILDFDKTNEVKISIESKELSDIFDFDIFENRGGWNKGSVELRVDLKDYVLVDSDTFENMGESIEDLKDEVSELNNYIDELEKGND